MHLTQDSLALEVLLTQRRLELPSLWTECLQFLCEVEVNLKELMEMTKMQFKRRIKHAVREKNRNDLLQMMEPYKKLNSTKLSQENFEIKSYFNEMNLNQARVKFAIDTNMLKTIKSHYPSDKKYEDDLWECQHCSRIDSVRHLMRCPAFEDLRVDKNLHSNTNDIVTYFQQIINIRMENGQAQHY